MSERAESVGGSFKANLLQDSKRVVGMEADERHERRGEAGKEEEGMIARRMSPSPVPLGRPISQLKPGC